MAWGKGGMVGVRKAIWQHERTLQQAARILETEHGIRHKPGERPLCPLCQVANRQPVPAEACTDLGANAIRTPYPWCHGSPTKADCAARGYCNRDPNCGE